MSLLWIPVTLIAALAQTARNATQASLVAALGTAGATQVRFLYGLPFSVVFLLALCLATGAVPPTPGAVSLGYAALGASAQIAATALMLAAMRSQSFAVAVALIKAEPVLVALFGLIVLGDALTPMKALAILVATAGVAVLSAPVDAKLGGDGRAIACGVAAGACFAMAAVGFRGAIVSLPHEHAFYMRATTILVVGLTMQTLALGLWLALFDRKALTGSLKVWRASLAAGALGAIASQFWFLGFSLTSAANVRTLALVEVLFAQIVSRRVFAQSLSRREIAGMALIVAGVGLLLAVAI